MWVVILLLLPCVLHAGKPQLPVPGVTGKDNRVISDSRHYPWSAVGRLNITTGGFCTATVIGPRRVLTAAHCLWNKRTARWYPPCALHFLAGYQRGEYAVHALVSRIDIVSGYTVKKHRIDQDWAVVTLDRDVSSKTGIVDIAESDANADLGLMQAGYSRDRAHVLTVDRDCRRRGLAASGYILLHDCDATFGDSGSPILQRNGDRFTLIGVHVAIRGRGEQTTGIAVTSRAFHDWIRDNPVTVPPGGVKACGVRSREMNPNQVASEQRAPVEVMGRSRQEVIAWM